MRSNRARGRRGELEYAKLFEGTRISKLGESGPDVVDGWGNIVEIKKVRRLPVALRAWLTQAEREGAHMVAFREDRGEWFVLMPAKHFYLLEAGIDTEA